MTQGIGLMPRGSVGRKRPTPRRHAEACQESLWIRGAAEGEVNAASERTLAPASRIHPVPG